MRIKIYTCPGMPEAIALIRAEEFGEPKQPPPPFFEEFAAICLDGQRPPALRSVTGSHTSGPWGTLTGGLPVQVTGVTRS